MNNIFSSRTKIYSAISYQKSDFKTFFYRFFTKDNDLASRPKYTSKAPSHIYKFVSDTKSDFIYRFLRIRILGGLFYTQINDIEV